MLDIKIVTEVGEGLLLTSAIIYEPKINEWVYETVLWDSFKGEKKNWARFGKSNQLSCLEEHLLIANARLCKEPREGW